MSPRRSGAAAPRRNIGRTACFIDRRRDDHRFHGGRLRAALKQAGAARVVLATVARVDRRLKAPTAQPVSSGGEEIS
jgi:hypothetical protein